MELKIEQDYKITSDSLQYILQERKVVIEGDKKGKEYWVNVGYYGKIYQALRSYKELQIRNSSVTTARELMDLIKKLDEKIETLLLGN